MGYLITLFNNHLATQSNKSQVNQETQDMSGSVECSELPSELFLPIGKGLDTRIEILRFRGVCKSWRSAISCSDFIPRFPLKFPNPLPPPRRRPRLGLLATSHDEADHLHQQIICLLHETILYRLTPSELWTILWCVRFYCKIPSSYVTYGRYWWFSMITYSVLSSMLNRRKIKAWLRTIIL